MEIYFAGSIRGGRVDTEIYFEIIKILQEYGEVLTEHIGLKDLNSMGESDKTSKYIFNRDVEWLTSSDVVVAEVTNPSLGVGYEIGIAEKLNKKIICLYRQQEGKRLSAMIEGNSKILNHTYNNVDELRVYFDSILK